MTKQKAPFATWKSPITADAIVSNSISIDDVLVDPLSSTIYHIEKRSTGSSAIVNTTTGHDIVAGDWNVRTAVHEYGGAAAIAYDGIIYFSNEKDGRVYRVINGKQPEAVTEESTVHLFANFAVHTKRPELLVSILEDHTVDTPQTVKNSLCVINTVDKKVYPVGGLPPADFYASPLVSPDGRKLAWQQWYHPDMPWEGAELFIADIVDGEKSISLANVKLFAGKKKDISAAYPSWVNNTTILFTSDETGYQNPWVYSTTTDQARCVFSKPVSEDFSGPAWKLGGSPYAIIDASGHNALFTAFRGGRQILYTVELTTGAPPDEVSPCPFIAIDGLRQISPGKPELVFSGMKSDGPGGVIKCTLSASAAPVSAEYTVLKSTQSSDSASVDFPPEIISAPKPLTFTVPPHDDPLHVVFYEPTNPDYDGSSIPGEKPPCIVSVHGGPTSIESQALSWTKQFWTSRGWAWLDVNYGGSSGYGRSYTGLLEGRWGIKDVADCLQAAKSLSESIDLARVFIRGHSSGGYAALSAVSFGPEQKTFYAGATSSCGISNLRLLATFTHKFELTYMEKLLGGKLEDIPDVYDKERSPIYHADQIETPLLILQGSKDRVVPPPQAEAIVKSIQDRGGKVKYVLFEGEGHGNVQAPNIIKALETELEWYEEILKNSSKK